MAAVKITISQVGYSGPLSAVWLDTSTQKVYSNSGLTTQIFEFPIPSGSDKSFRGYFNNATTGTTQYATSAGAFTPELLALTSAKTIHAQGDELKFGGVVDYFRLMSTALVPESSDSGETKPHVVAYNATSEAPATEVGPIWMNPRVTYRVVGSTTLNVTLGAAFAGKADGTTVTSKMTQTGYMITSVEVSTAIGEAPTVTVSGVANEGFTWNAQHNVRTTTATNAVKTYAVSIALSPRHRPQNLSGAVSGGGQLQQLTFRAVCDPVVTCEDNCPSASDVVHGRIEVSAVTGAYNRETAPTAGSGFTSLGAVEQRSGVGYKTWNINVRKELT